MSLNDYIDAIARQLSLSKAEVQFCFDEADVTLSKFVLRSFYKIKSFQITHSV